jgi:fibronectin-binding autotransporter adhesin
LPGSGARTLTLTGTFVINTDGTNQYNSIGGLLADNGGPTSLIKNGSGEWVITGANTYTGGTTINAGTLLLAHGDNRLWPGGSLTINAGGQLELFTGDSAFASELITQEVVQLSGAGRIRLNAGTLWASNSTGMTSTFSGTIDDTDVDTDISKETGGSIAKRGFGTLILTGSNSYTGKTLVQAGTLEVTTLADAGVNSSIGASTVANPAENLVLGSESVSGTLRWVGSTSQSTNRNFTLAAGGGGIDASGGGAATLTLTGAMTAPSGGSQTFTLSGTNTGNNTLAGQIVNGTSGNVTSLVKSGPGKWVLSHANNTYTGPTSINAGSLALSAASGNNISSSASIAVATGAHLDVTGLTGGALTLSSSQTLSGGGTVWGDVTVNGIVSPGASVGNLTTTGSQTWAPGGDYVWEISDATEGAGGNGVRWDHLSLQSLSISATSGSKFTLQVVALPGGGGPELDNFDPLIGYTWTVATASGAITGFSADKFDIDLSLLTNNNSPIGNFVLFTSGSELRLRYVPEPSSALLAVVGAAALLQRRRRS